MASSVRLSDWVQEAESIFGLKFSHEHEGKTSDYTLVTFKNHLGEPHYAHVYDERVTVMNSDLKRRYSNFFSSYSSLKIQDDKLKQNVFHERSSSLHQEQKLIEAEKERKITREEGSRLAETKVSGSILRPYAHHRLQNLVGFLYQTPRKGSILDLMYKYGKLTDDQAMLICTKILEALDMLHRANLVVTVIPLKCIFIDVNDVYLDIMRYVTSSGLSAVDSRAFTQQTIKSVGPKDYMLLPPEVVHHKRITFETGVYCFGMLLYVLIEVGPVLMSRECISNYRKSCMRFLCFSQKLKAFLSSTQSRAIPSYRS